MRALWGFVWADTSVKTPTWRRRHSRRACFPDQGRGGAPRGAAGTPWRLGCSCHPTQLASQQCTQMTQNSSERPFPPICVHSCVPQASRVTTVRSCTTCKQRGRLTSAPFLVARHLSHRPLRGLLPPGHRQATAGASWAQERFGSVVVGGKYDKERHESWVQAGGAAG